MQSNVLSGELENIYRVECNQMYCQVNLRIFIG